MMILGAQFNDYFLYTIKGQPIAPAAPTPASKTRCGYFSEIAAAEDLWFNGKFFSKRVPIPATAILEDSYTYAIKSEAEAALIPNTINGRRVYSYELQSCVDGLLAYNFTFYEAPEWM